MTIVNSRMNSKAPVSFVTTTATNESSPEPPNSGPEWPSASRSPHGSLLLRGLAVWASSWEWAKRVRRSLRHSPRTLPAFVAGSAPSSLPRSQIGAFHAPDRERL